MRLPPSSHDIFPARIRHAFCQFFSPIVVATRRQPIIVPIPSANATAIMITPAHTQWCLTYPGLQLFSRRWSSLLYAGTISRLCRSCRKCNANATQLTTLFSVLVVAFHVYTLCPFARLSALMVPDGGGIQSVQSRPVPETESVGQRR